VSLSIYLRSIAKRCLEAESGASAIEFALICPLLVAGFLSAADIGLAVNRKMTVDAMLRAGAEAALSDPGTTKVQDVATYASGSGAPPDISISATRSCSCPESISVTVSCSTICAGSKSPYVFYNLSASGYYNTIFFPRISLHSGLVVQVK